MTFAGIVTNDADSIDEFVNKAILFEIPVKIIRSLKRHREKTIPDLK